ncbi:TPA: hypothetical protein H1011_01405 [archaeon]|uniref:Uncharacterized protein n=1 Tax=Candidatus Undinarchaeum marinum TaxID=2756141 RepID=A0A832UY90_9ARCH|nr:hypothetical protein [Candidatus Undinarchaeum marinum]
MANDPFKKLMEWVENEELPDREEILEREKSRVIDQISKANKALGMDTTMEIMKLVYPDTSRLTEVSNKIEEDTSLERLKAITSYLRSFAVAYKNSKKREETLSVHEWSLQKKEEILDRYDAAKKKAKKLGIRKIGEYPKTFLDILRLMRDDKIAEANFLLLQIEGNLMRIGNDLEIFQGAHEDAGALKGFTSGKIIDDLKNDFKSCLKQIDQIYKEAQGEADLAKLDELKQDLKAIMDRIRQIMDQAE